MSEATSEDDLWAILEGLRHATFDEAEPPKGAGAGAPPPVKRRMKEAHRSMWDTEGDEPGEHDAEACCFCKTGTVVTDDGQRVCRDCFAVISRVIDMGAEWRFYGSEDTRCGDPARCGMPASKLMPRSSLGTFIGGMRSANRDIRRIQLYQKWGSMLHDERALYKVFDNLRVDTHMYGIPSKVVDDAIIMYKKASALRISRSDNKEGLIASCIYHACIVNKVSRSPKEVAEMFNLQSSIMTKGNSRFQNLLHLNVDTVGPEEFIARFGSKLSMNYADIQACKDFVRRLDEMEIVSESAPTSVAAAALYYYCTKKGLADITRSLISDACSVSEVTIIKCNKRLLRYKEVADAYLAASAKMAGVTHPFAF